jgi:hypothetical protein
MGTHLTYRYYTCFSHCRTLLQIHIRLKSTHQVTDEMAPEAEGSTYYLLRMPYKILEPIIAIVSSHCKSSLVRSIADCISQLKQGEQLTLAKTCVTLWELAYPLVYNRIIVKIGLKPLDTAWKDLVSGVGLRYVRHLEIRSLYDANDGHPKRVEDLVASTIIAALRRNKLLSFR